MTRRETLGIRIASRLGRLIVTGRLRTGEKLVETTLARRFGISRAPLREAVKELERQGLVAKQPRRGARVLQPTARDVKEIYEIKTMLDGLAARLAAERITERQLNRLRAICRGMQDHVVGGDSAGYAGATRRFHQVFVEASRNSRLIQMYEAMSQQIWWLSNIVLTRSERQQTSLLEHEEILEALVARDGKRAQAVAEEHVRHGGEFFLEKFLWGQRPAGRGGLASRATRPGERRTPGGQRVRGRHGPIEP